MRMNIYDTKHPSTRICIMSTCQHIWKRRLEMRCYLLFHIRDYVSILIVDPVSLYMYSCHFYNVMKNEPNLFNWKQFKLIEGSYIKLLLATSAGSCCILWKHMIFGHKLRVFFSHLCCSGALAAQRAAKWSPIPIWKGKETHKLIFSWLS